MNYAGPLRRLYAFTIDIGLLMLIIFTVAPVSGDSLFSKEAAIPREMIGKFVSFISGTVGIVWLVFDPKRQGWHDKIAGTFVVDNPYSGGPQFLRDFFKLGEKTDDDSVESEDDQTPDPDQTTDKKTESGSSGDDQQQNPLEQTPNSEKQGKH